MSGEVQGNQNSLSSSFRSGTAYLYLTEQDGYQAAIADGHLSQDEITSMNLTYQGTQYTVGELLDRYSGHINLSIFRDDLIAATETTALTVADMSSSGATATTTEGITQDELCDMLMDEMVMDEIKKQLRETAAQGNGEFSYDQDDSE